MNKLILGLLALLFPLLASGQITTPGGSVTGPLGSGTGSPSTTPAVPITNLLWHNTLFLDATNGNDSTYIIGDASKPARTLAVAFDALQNNMMLYVRPGFYLVESFLASPTNGIPLYGKTNVYIYGPGAVWYADARGTMIAMGFCTNVTFDGMTMQGVRDEAYGPVTIQSAAVWIEGDSSDITFKNVTIKNWINQGIATYRHPDHWWGYRNIRVVDSNFEWIGFTNFSVGLPNDGCAIVICGDDTAVERNMFRFNLRDFETFTHSDAIPDQVWRNGRLVGNMSVGCMENFYAQGATNIQDWLIAGNNVYMFQTNRQLVAAGQYAMRLYGGENVLIENNMIHGSQYGIEIVPASGGVFKNLTIKNNTIVAIDNAVFNGFGRLTGDPGRHLTHIYIEGNTAVQCGGYGIFAGFSYGTIKDNVWLDMGTNGACNRVIYTSGTDYPCGGFFDTIPCTNLVVSGNWIGHRSQGAGYTDDTIHIGNRTYGAYVDGNFLATDMNPIVNVGSNTVGILALAGGQNFNDYIGGATTVGSLWTRTNATTGQGTWDNTPVLAGLAFTANEGSWLFSIGDNVSSDSLVITNAGFEGAGMSFSAESFRVHGAEMSTKSVYASNIYAANFIQTNGFNESKFYGWGGTNVQFRMVKNITLTNVADVSAAAYYPSNGTFLTTHNNNNGRVTEWTLGGVFVRKIDWTAGQIPDAESVTYMGGDKFGIVDEDSNRIIIFTVTNGAGNVTISTNGLQIIKLSASIAVDGASSGVEGIAFDWDRDGWWVAHEKNPAQLLFVSKDGATTNNWFSTAQMQTFTNANNTDFSDVYLDRENQILWVAQDEGAASQTDRIIGISLVTSNVICTLNVTNFGQLEGVSVTPDGKIIVGGEANQFAIFEPVLGGLKSSISWTKNSSTNLPDTVQFPFGWAVGPSASQAVFTNVLTASATIDFASAGSGSREDRPITVAGAKEGDYVTVAPPVASTTSIIGTYTGFASNGAVYVRFTPMAAAQDPASGTFRVMVHQAR